MRKKQILVSAIAVAAIAVLLSLPKVVVDNEGRNNNLESRQDAAEMDDASAEAAAIPESNPLHTAEIPADMQKKIDSLRENYSNSADSEKSAIFAASLIDAYQSVDWFDSAAWFAEQVARQSRNRQDERRVGDLYYEAFAHSMDASRAQALGSKARLWYEKVLQEAPGDLEVKNKLAMTYVSTSDPMRGITMLREILEEDENNELAIFNLGLLSFQSGQHQKAVERFEKLVSLRPDHLQGHYWLGVSYFELGQKKKARNQFEKVKQMDSGDPEIEASVENYLSRI